MTIIEADGLYTEPLQVDTLEINSGQRYSVLITTNQSPDNYQMSSRVLWRKAGPTGLSFLHYTTAVDPPVNPSLAAFPGVPFVPAFTAFNQPPQPEWIGNQLRPLARDFTSPPTQVTKTILLVGKQAQITDAHNVTRMKWVINDVAFEAHDSEPLLVSAVRGDAILRAAVGPSSRSLVFRIDYNDVVDLVLQNTVALNGMCEQHPWHIHGHHFYDLGGGPGAYIDHVASGTLAGYLNSVNPIMRDTTTLYPHSSAYFQNSTGAGASCGFRVVRFVADNPGMLFLVSVEFNE
jgi:L-ascorbate oxidase